MIVGKRVRLRTFKDEDLRSCLAWVNNPRVTRFLLHMRPVSVAEERAWIERAMRNDDPSLRPFVIESMDAEYLGGVTLSHIDPRNRACEVGIVIGNPDYWGRGFGAEAMVLAVRHAFEEMNLHRVSLRVYEFNDRARRSYRKIGFAEEGLLRQ